MMKKTFIFLSIVLLGVVLLAGCKKDGLETFTATIQRYDGGEKAYIDDDYYACWTNGDLVKVNSTTCTASVAYVDDSSLVRIPGVPRTSDGYYAIYPAKVSPTGNFGNGSTITLPQEQEYRVVGAGGNHQVLDAPMAAMADGNNVLKFQNLCFLLKVHIGQSNNKLQAIMVEAADNTVKLSGSGTVTFDGSGTPSLTMTSGTNSVILTMTTPVSLNVSGGTDFYIAIPAIAQGKVLNIITKDVLNAYQKVSITAQNDIPSNIIVGVDGPDVTSSTEYEFYDWIQSDSSGYIDLGVRPTFGAEMELTFSIPTYAGERCSQYLCGSRLNGSSTQWFTITGGGGYGGSQNGFNVLFCNEKAENTPANGGWIREQNKKYQISVQSENYDGGVRAKAIFRNLTDGLENTLYTPKYTGTVDWGTLPHVYLFAFNVNQKHAGMRCYGFRYIDGSGEVVHDFVPCKEISSNLVGVYDMIDTGFIAPVQTGTHPFTVGND
jgi:hypothetical protein